MAMVRTFGINGAHHHVDDLYELILVRADGRPMRLARYWGQVLLVVNVASHSPQAGQLRGLEELHQRYGPNGLKIMAFPCDDFDNMEPGSDSEIQQRYEQELGLSFPVFSKATLNRVPGHPFFEMLVAAHERRVNQHSPGFRTPLSPEGAVRSNFEKFLISREGTLLERFGSSVEPHAPSVLSAIERALHSPRGPGGSA